jgi:hypothetical protein
MGKAIHALPTSSTIVLLGLRLHGGGSLRGRWRDPGRPSGGLGGRFGREPSSASEADPRRVWPVVGTGRACQEKNWPPFAEIVEPVMKPASSEARKTTQRAISSGSPRRPTGICGMMRSASTFSSIARTISVPM